jgi:uncharacterized protein (TIGR00255 family)
MIRSMTGYGAAAVDTAALSASATIRSLNHRYLDLSVHLSRNLQSLEPEVKELVQSSVGRGKIDVSVSATLTDGAKTARVVTLPFAAELVKTLRALREEHALAGDVTIGDMARFGAVEVVESPLEFTAPQRESLLGVVRQALSELARMRDDEGKNLGADLARRLDAIEQAAARIEGLMAEGRTARIAALREKVKAIGTEMGLDEPRLYAEVVRLVDRQDTTEELERLRSHIAQVRALLRSPEAVGKRLDFLAQELNREANTIGSKAAAAPVIQEVVGLKAEIEKLREQVQNVE